MNSSFAMRQRGCYVFTSLKSTREGITRFISYLAPRNDAGAVPRTRERAEKGDNGKRN